MNYVSLGNKCRTAYHLRRTGLKNPRGLILDEADVGHDALVGLIRCDFATITEVPAISFRESGIQFLHLSGRVGVDLSLASRCAAEQSERFVALRGQQTVFIREVEDDGHAEVYRQFHQIESALFAKDYLQKDGTGRLVMVVNDAMHDYSSAPGRVFAHRRRSDQEDVMESWRGSDEDWDETLANLIVSPDSEAMSL